MWDVAGCGDVVVMVGCGMWECGDVGSELPKSSY